MSISVVEETDSTQDDLIAAVQRDGAAWPHLSGLRALVQRAGRGRGGREWETSNLRALTISYVLRPGAPVSEWATIALRAGAAVVRALADHGVGAMIKWPNDVVVETPTDVPGWHGIAKVGGILGTVVQDSTDEYVCVLGIGLNLQGAVSVPSAGVLGTDVDAGLLAEAIRAELFRLLPEDPGAFVPLGDLVAAHCHTLGKAVMVSFPQEDPPREVRGTASRIDPDGALIVATPEGEVRILNGDIAHTRLQPR